MDAGAAVTLRAAGWLDAKGRHGKGRRVKGRRGKGRCAKGRRVGTQVFPAAHSIWGDARG